MESWNVPFLETPSTNQLPSMGLQTSTARIPPHGIIEHTVDLDPTMMCMILAFRERLWAFMVNSLKAVWHFIRFHRPSWHIVRLHEPPYAFMVFHDP